MALTADQERYWRAYLESLGPAEAPQAPVVTAGYAGGPELTDELSRLYLEGRKHAGSSVLQDFLTAGDRVPQVGDHWILLGSDGEPRCILRTTRIEVHAFADVPSEVAVAEGEGDLSVAHWRRVHEERYAPDLQAWGLAGMDEATIVTEFFDLVFEQA